MATAWSFGDLVVVRGTAGVGLIAELRRADCRVQYLGEGRSVWAELRDLRRTRDDETAGSIERLVSELLDLLGAAELEFTRPGPGRCRLLASHGALVPETIDRVRRMLGDRLTGFVIRPLGMHRMQSILEFRA